MRGFLRLPSSKSLHVENLNCLLITKSRVLPNRIPYLDKIGIGNLVRRIIVSFSNIFK